MRPDHAFNEAMLDRMEGVYGHPTEWPRPAYTKPRFYQIARQLEEAQLARGLALHEITEDMRDRFYAEHALGQHWSDDAGGFLLRCYRAMLGLPLEPRPALSDAMTPDVFKAYKTATEQADYEREKTEILGPLTRGTPMRVEHDGFEGVVLGTYETLEGKRGYVCQLRGARIVHVYGEKWVVPA